MAKKKVEKTIGGGSFRERALSLTKLDKSSVMSESEFFDEKFFIPTEYPLLNLAMSGSVDKGLYPGVKIVAGPSRHFKTSFSLVDVSAFLKAKPNGTVLFYDNEFGTSKEYMKQFDVDIERVIHLPFKNLEELKFDMCQQLENMAKEDEGNVFMFVDSIGSAASKKEMNDAMDGNGASDMTRAKEVKSLMRIVLPWIKQKNVYSTFIAHTYQTMEMFSKQILGSGQGLMLAANNVWFIGRAQGEKDDDKNLLGYNFTIKAEKSRFVQEGKKFPISVTWENGIEKYSGLSELAEEMDIIEKVKDGRSFVYKFGELTSSPENINIDENFWNQVFTKSYFKYKLSQEFKLVKTNKNGEKVDKDTGEIVED